MRKSRPSMFLLLAALVLVGLGGWAWLGGKGPAREGDFHDYELGPAGAPPPEGVDLARFAAESADAPDVEPVRVLATEDAALFGSVCDLQLLAEGTELKLSGRQWTSLAAAVVQLQAVRHSYEAEIARVQAVSPDRHRIEIPAYPEAGDELRRQLHRELRANLGEAVATDVIAKLGGRLEGHFAGFGVSDQTLEIVGDPAGAPGAVQVEREARYWNSVDGRDRLTTRREVHLPAVEDPVGDNWHALLALVIKTD